MEVTILVISAFNCLFSVCQKINFIFIISCVNSPANYIISLFLCQRFSLILPHISSILGRSSATWRMWLYANFYAADQLELYRPCQKLRLAWNASLFWKPSPLDYFHSSFIYNPPKWVHSVTKYGLLHKWSIQNACDWQRCQCRD